MINEFKKIKSDTKVELNCLVRESGHKKWLVCTHGIGEHLMRHEYIIKNLAQNFNICLYDLRGHGDSTGKVAYVDSFDEYYHDLEEVCSYLRKTFAMDEYYLFGHSMGALITAGFVQNYLSNKPHPTKIFLSAPPVTVNGPHGAFFHYAPFGVSHALANLPFSIPLKGLVNLKYLSHDKRVIQEYTIDPKVHMALHSKLLLNLVAEARKVFSRPLRTTAEIYVAFGEKDGIINKPIVRKYFSEIEKKANVFEVEGGFHELHNEIDKYKIPYLDFLKKSLLGTT